MLNLNFNPLKLKIQKHTEESTLKPEEEVKEEISTLKTNNESLIQELEIKENKESAIIAATSSIFPDEMIEPDVYLEDEFSIVFNDKISRNSVKKAIELLKNLQKKALMLKYSDSPERDIYINFYINSPGGSVIDGFILVDMIEKSPIPVYTIVRGMAASMAVPLLLSGKKKYAYKHSVFLIHQMSTVLAGKMEDIKDNLKLTSDLEEMLKSYIKEKTKINVQELETLYKRES